MDQKNWKSNFHVKYSFQVLKILIFITGVIFVVKQLFLLISKHRLTGVWSEKNCTHVYRTGLVQSSYTYQYQKIFLSGESST